LFSFATIASSLVHTDLLVHMKWDFVYTGKSEHYSRKNVTSLSEQTLDHACHVLYFTKTVKNLSIS